MCISKKNKYIWCQNGAKKIVIISNMYNIKKCEYTKIEKRNILCRNKNMIDK